MPEDPRGIPLSTTSPEAAARFEQALTAFLAQRAEFGPLLAETLALDPGFIVARCLAGFAQLFGARRPMVAQAGAHLEQARIAWVLNGGTPREAALIAALGAWHDDGDMWRAVALLDAAGAPRDLLMLRLSYAIRFMLGDAAGMRRTVEAALPAWSPDLHGHAFLLGCHAFALGETGEPRRAAEIGQAGCAMEPRDLWGAHAVAHALGALRRPREGIAWIAWLAPHMEGGGSFVRHIHWHRALCHLRLGEADAALALFDARIGGPDWTDVRDVLNAASLLWRLQAAGVAPGGRWTALADIAEARIGEHCWSFADLHYVIALAAAGRGDALAGMLGSIAARARHGDTQAVVHREIGLATARAAAATAAGEREVGAALFAAAPCDAHRLGGSIAQRDLLRQMRAHVERDAAGATVFAREGS